MSSRLCIVTGGSRGIGKAIASKLLNNGHSVIVVGKNNSNLKKVKAEFKSKQFYTIQFDLGQPNRIEELVQSIALIERDIGQKTTSLINSAGITYDKLLLQSNTETIENLLNVNLISPILLTKAILRGMLAEKYGSVINISSIAGLNGAAGQSIYSTTKAGLIGFTKSISKEMACRNITANVIAPGFVDTNMLDGLDKLKLLKSIPGGKFTTAEEVADLVWFVLQSRSINGSCLTLDYTYQ